MKKLKDLFKKRRTLASYTRGNIGLHNVDVTGLTEEEKDRKVHKLIIQLFGRSYSHLKRRDFKETLRYEP